MVPTNLQNLVRWIERSFTSGMITAFAIPISPSRPDRRPFAVPGALL
jgi:hypothetical protein